MTRTIARSIAFSALWAAAAWSQVIPGCTPATLPQAVGSTVSVTCTPSGGTAPYTWSISPGALPPGLTQNPSTGKITGALTDPAGPYSFSVVATDSTSLSGSQAYSGTTVDPLSITTATVPNGVVNVVYPNTTLQAQGGTTPYTWSVSSGALPAGMTLSAGGVLSGKPTASGPFTFTAKVTDSTSPTALTATQSYTFTVVAGLSITTATVPNGVVNMLYPNTTLQAQGGTTPYTWSVSSGALPAGMTLTSGGVLSGTPTASGPFTFTAKVTDSTSPTALTATQSYTFTIVAGLSITTIAVPNGVANVVYPNTTLQAQGGTTPYTWSVSSGALPAGMTLTSGGVLSGTPTASGPFTFTAKVTDSTSPTALTATQSYTFTIVAGLSITTATVPNGVVNVVYPNTTLQAQGGTTPYTWSVSSGALPAGMTLTSGGVLSGTPTASGPFTFTAKVTDSTSPTALTATQSYTFTIVAGLSITTSTVPNGVLNVVYPNTTLQAQGGTTPYTWSVSSGALPAGMTLTSGGVLSGTPTASGPFTFTAKVTDSTSPTALTATRSYTFTVVAGLSITTLTVPNGVVNVVYPNTTLQAQGGTTPYTWSISAGALPAGMTLTSGGVLSGTPTASGPFTFTAKVTDSTSPTALTATQIYTFTIVAGLSITTSTVPNAVVNMVYPTTTLQAQGGTTPYTWSISAGALPAGMTLTSGGALSGTPTASGPFTFTAKVTDSTSPTPMTASQQYTFTVVATLAITTTTVPNGVVNVAYPNTTLQAQGGTTPYTWSISAGALPAGMTLTAAGVLGGTPSATGAFSFTAKVTDSTSPTPLTASQQYSFTVVATLAINTTTVPNGVMGTAYPNTPLQAQGGTTPYTWSISAGALPAGMTLTSAGVLSGTPSATGAFSFTAKVTDSTSPTPLSATQQYSFTIATPVTIATSSPLPTGTVGVAYSQTLKATGGSGQYTWSISSGSLPAGLTLTAATGVISGQPTTGGTANFTIQATDSNQLTASAPFTLTINPALSIITSAPLPTGTVGVSYAQTVIATGGSGQYTWSVSSGSLPAGLSLNSSTGVISGVPGSSGSSSPTIQVTDSNQVTATKSLPLTINPALSITTTSPLPPGTVGIAYSQTLKATGGSGQYTWSVSSGSLPAGLSLNSANGIVSGQPTAAGTSNFKIQVTDTNSVTASTSFALTIDVLPSITTSSPLANGIVGVAYNQTLAGTGGALPYTWSVTSGALPGGLNLGSTGVISGSPATTGSFTFTVELKDSTSPANTATKQFAITVGAGLTITTAGLPNATVGIAYSQTISAAGGGPPYTWSITSGALPAGLTLSSTSSTTAAITGTPSAAGQSTFTVTVRDASSSTANQNFTLTVVVTPSITTASLPNGIAGLTYSATLAASGGTAPYTWSISGGSLPAGLSLSASGSISGKPTAPGTSSFTVQVKDANGVTGSKAFTITITAGLTITTTSPLPAGEPNIAYSQNLAASGGTSPYKWAVIAGALPPGLTLSSAGAITGKPASVGGYNFTVQATDSNNITASAPLALTIAAAVSISTPAALPNGSLDAGYSQALTAAGGVAPYKWAITGGALPHGLTLSSAGVISGITTASGTSSFTATVTDSLGATASRQFTILIVAGLTISTPSALPGATVGVPYADLLQAAGGTGPYTWNLFGGSLPAGLTLQSNGNVTGIPTSVGLSTFTVKATDSLGNQATEQMSLTVAPVLSITTTTLPGASVGTPYSQSLAASGGTPPYTWSLLNGSLPGGLTLSANGTIAGTPNAGGTFSFTAKIADSAGVIAIKQLSIAVAGGISVTSAASLPNAKLNTSYTESLAAAGGTPPYTWSLTAGALPAGLTLSAAGVISGSPSAAGTFQFTATATDSVQAAASEQFTLIVTGALAISPATLPSGKIGTAYSQALTASGGTAPYTFAVSAGSLPPGLTLNAGLISGTPTTNGSSMFTVKVTDNVSATATQQYTIAITGLGLSTAALPGAAVGTAYSFTLQASGVAPYTWAITQGTLPAGLSLDPSTGTISGTPTAASTSTVTVQVTDSTKATASEALTLTVVSASFSGLSGTATSTEQLSGALALGAPYPQAITGQVTLAFVPDASLTSPADDPAIQFASGGLTSSFTIPANSTAPVNFQLQTGTVAGIITLTVSWQAGGATLAVPAALTQTIQIAPAAPVITAVSASTTSSGFQVVITGYSNTRDVSSASLQFTAASGQSLQTTTLSVPLSSESTAWFGSSTSDQYGSQFILTLPFTVSDGSTSAIGSISVQLVNTQGTSNSMSAAF